MAIRKIYLILALWLIILISGCNNESNPQNLNNNITKTIAVQQTGTALAASKVLETPGFVLNTPTIVFPTPSLTITPVIPNGSKLAVVMIKEGDVLNVYSNPGEQNGVVTTLTAHAIGIAPTGNFRELDGENWLEIRTADDTLGWVKAEYITEQIPSNQFCAGAKNSSLVSQFMKAVQARDGAQLAQLVNPRRGLIIRHEWWNPEVRFIGQDFLEGIFNDTTSQDWGIQDGTGIPIEGAFRDVILPKLDDILTDSVSTCNSLDHGLASGGSIGYIQWPFEYTNFNYIALYRAASEGDELNWRTWAFGIEYVNQTPYITCLVQYHWEN